MFKLVAVDGDAQHLLDKERVTVGRDQSCDIRIVAGKVSKQHALLIVDQDIVSVEDLNSTNGTFVNNRQVRSRRNVSAGDVIRFESVAYYLSSSADESHTILARNLPKSAATSGRSKIAIDARESSDSTVFAEDYSLPADWPTADNDPLFTDRARKYTTEQVDRLLGKYLPQYADATAVLVIMSGNPRTPLFGLKVSRRKHHWTLGRSPDQLICLSDISVSARHATLIYDRDRWAIRDENSSNRVKVNNKAQTLSPLVDGDVIALGMVDLVFRLTPSSSA